MTIGVDNCEVADTREPSFVVGGELPLVVDLKHPRPSAVQDGSVVGPTRLADTLCTTERKVAYVLLRPRVYRLASRGKPSNALNSTPARGACADLPMNADY